MDVFDKLKDLSLNNHIWSTLWQNINPWWVNKVFFNSSKNDKTPSLCVFNDRDYNDYSGRLWGWTIIDFEMKYFDIDKNEAVQKLCSRYWITRDQKDFVKSPKRKDLIVNFNDYKLEWINGWLSRFLWTRWISYEIIKDYSENLDRLASELGFVNNIWIKWEWENALYKDSIIFPCLDSKEELRGLKLRTIDWTPFDFKGKDVKSVAVSSTWLIYKKSDLSEDIIIVEGETDYLILKMLWFNSVIWNLWGVTSNKQEIKDLTKKSNKIICFYDNDSAWVKAVNILEEFLWRPIRRIEYPKIEGMDKYDINDLFKVWYGVDDFDLLINNAKLLWEFVKETTDWEEVQELFKDRVFYNNKEMAYFDTVSFKFKQPNEVARHYDFKPADLEEVRIAWGIPTYEWVCYLDWGRKGYYNLLSKKQIVLPSEKAEYHPDIKKLIDNLCNYDKINSEWLLKAIAYKYTHLNDAFIPAVVFHWPGWSWKGLLLKLLEAIFWSDNTMIWLTQNAIDSQYSSYSGQKLIVEFKEIAVENTAKWKKNLNKLKTFIMEDTIMVRMLYQNPIPVDNIAWFIMSSNDSRPIYLDSWDSGNRRFTIIKTWWYMPKNPIWGNIAKTLKNPENIKNFLCYLLQKFPNIQNEDIEALDNQAKQDLQFLSESTWNLFFKWFEERYPNINIITNQEKAFFLDIYKTDVWEDDWTDDTRKYFVQNFNSGLSPRYVPKVVKARWKSSRWYRIDKKVEWCGYFEKDFLTDENFLESRSWNTLIVPFGKR